MPPPTETVRQPLPPGPRTPWLGIGLLRQWARSPVETPVRLQRDYGDLVRARIVFSDYLWVFDPAIARQVLLARDDDFVKDARQLDVFQDIQGRNVLTVEGTDWQRQRRILTPAFSPRRMAGYLTLMQQAADATFRDMLPASPGTAAELDAETFCTRLTMDVISRALFSEKITADTSARVSEAIAVLSRQGQREMFWLRTPPPWLPYPGRRTKLAAARQLNDWIARQIDQRLAAPRRPADEGDMLDAMLGARDDTTGTGLSRQEVHDNCMAIFLAGHETSAKALAWWMGLMAHHPAEQESVRRELDSLPGATFDDPADLNRALESTQGVQASLKEAMRLYPPIFATFMRRARRELVLGGYRVARGTGVSVFITNLQRDPRWFPDPDTFRPARFLPGAPDIPRGAYLPFGAGGHVCIGQHFATVEMALVAALLLRRFELAPLTDSPLPPARLDIVLRPARPIRLRVTARAGEAVRSP
ncbi:MAG: cytochrome P450 [Betaproteobacteria bacterium]